MASCTAQVFERTVRPQFGKKYALKILFHGQKTLEKTALLGTAVDGLSQLQFLAPHPHDIAEQHGRNFAAALGRSSSLSKTEAPPIGKNAMFTVQFAHDEQRTLLILNEASDRRLRERLVSVLLG